MATSPLGQRLKTLREERGLSQAQLAMRSGIPQGNISFIEAGKRLNIGMENLTALARGLHCSLDELVGFDKDATPEPAGVDGRRLSAVESQVREVKNDLAELAQMTRQGFEQIASRLPASAARKIPGKRKRS